MAKRILLVEDNEMIREMLSFRLQSRGYELIFAGNGRTAIENATEQLPDLILMDMNLPVIDGWEATRRLKKNPVTKHISVLALSAGEMNIDREEALAAGCDDYETKPVELNRLLQKMEVLIEKTHSA